MNFFYYESKFKIKKNFFFLVGWWGVAGGGGGGEATRVSEFFFTTNPNLKTRSPRRAVSHGGWVGGGTAQVQHQLQQWAKYWYSIVVWDVLTQSIYKG